MGDFEFWGEKCAAFFVPNKYKEVLFPQNASQIGGFEEKDAEFRKNFAENAAKSIRIDKNYNKTQDYIGKMRVDWQKIAQVFLKNASQTAILMKKDAISGFRAAILQFQTRFRRGR